MFGSVLYCIDTNDRDRDPFICAHHLVNMAGTKRLRSGKSGAAAAAASASAAAAAAAPAGME